MSKCKFCGAEYSHPVMTIHEKRCRAATKKAEKTEKEEVAPSGDSDKEPEKAEEIAKDGGFPKDISSTDLRVYILSECEDGAYTEEELMKMRRPTLLGVATAILKNKEE